MRYGKVKVSEEMLESFWGNIQGQFVPLEVEIKYCSGIWIYQGKSSFFDDLEDGDVIPTYQFVFERLNDDYVCIKGVDKLK